MIFFGPSNVRLVVLPSGATHDFNDPHSRFPMPDFGDPERSLPRIETDHPLDVAHLRKDGWVSDPKRVERTPEEREVVERAREEGSVTTQLMAKAFAEAAAKSMTEAAKETNVTTPVTKEKN